MRALIIAAASLVALPAAASAATVGHENGMLVYHGGPEQNWISTEYENGDVWIGDTAGTIQPTSSECAEDGWRVVCKAPSGGIVFRLGEGADQIDASGLYGFPAIIPVTVYGEGGADTLYANQSGHRNENVTTLDGGAGDDQLIGAEGRDILLGGPGDDDLLGGGDDDTLEGGDGNDLLGPDVGCFSCGRTTTPGTDVADGGAGHDKLDDWAGIGSPISVSLDGVANDGRPGENDNVIAIEEVTANVSGTYTMSDANDVVYVSNSAEQGANVVNGLGGSDRIAGGNQQETIDGGTGDDILEGGYGNDTITGGPGRDAIHGDSTAAQCGGYGQSCTVPFGNDTIHARDGEADTIDCGVGADTAIVDAADTVVNCETVDRAGGADAPSGPGTQGDGGTTSAGAKRCVVPKIKAGTKLARAKRRLKKAGCATKARKVRSKNVRKGRVVKTAQKTGSRPKSNTVILHVSRGRR